ncbi:hypothetical protein G9A89_021983 [Geosiphon pyriformis]|nr:hypothetical protein G9A89_021983 [Geosiphon pyriformis]
MEIPDHIYIIAQQLFQALSQQQLDMEIQPPKNNKNWTDNLIEKVKNTFGKIPIMELYINKSKRIFNQNIIQQIEEFIGKKINSTLHVKTMYQLHNIFENYPEILLHSDMETITINQWERMNNTQVEDIRNRVK